MTEAAPLADNRRYILWDTSALLPYYVPEAGATNRTHPRVKTLIDAVRHDHSDVHFYIPNIVVAEIFVALDRFCYAGWDTHTSKKFGGPGKTLHKARYNTARRRFRRDIHNGALFYQYELNRYHILGLDLISPVDKYRKFYRRGSVRSMGASDLLIGAMALHLARLHGSDRTALVTTDRRMEAIFSKACPRLNPRTARSLGLVASARNLGFGEWGSRVYPRVIDVARCSDSRLAEWFGGWPLQTRKKKGVAPKA